MVFPPRGSRSSLEWLRLVIPRFALREANDNLFGDGRYFFSTFQNTVTGEGTLPLTVLRRAMG
jgi:hypothetical protein